MKLNVMLLPVRKTSKTTAGKKYDYCRYLDELLTSPMIRRMQEKTEWIPSKNAGCAVTQYSYASELSAAARKIVYRVFENERFSEVDISDRSDICDMLACAALIKSSGKPPFGYTAGNAFSEWFSEEADSVYCGKRKLCDFFGPEMKKDICSGAGASRSVRNMLRYVTSDNDASGEIIKTVIDSETEYTGRRSFYAEKETIADIMRSSGIRKKRPPVSYILEAAGYIVDTLSVIEEAVMQGYLLCRQVLQFFRTAEDFDDDISTEEYESFCDITGHLSELYVDSRLTVQNTDDCEAFHRWIVRLRGKMLSYVADCFAENYDKIITGEFEGDLIGNSWCRSVKKILEKCKSQIYSNPGVAASISYSTEILKLIAGSFINAVISCDSGEKLKESDRRLVLLIPRRYSDMYIRLSDGKADTEKMYLRIMMVLDYIFSLTDSEAMSLLRTIKPLYSVGKK